MSHQSEKPIPPKMAVEEENSKIEAAASKQPPPAFFYSTGNSRLSPTENGQSSPELSSFGSNSPSPDQFEDKLRKCSEEIQKLREEMANLKGNNREMNLKLEKADICQKAQLRAAKAEAEVNAIGRELGEKMEKKEQKVGAKLVEMEKQMENMKREMDILKQNGAGSSGGAAAGGNGNGRQQYVSLAMSGDFEEGEGDQRPLLVNNSAANRPNGAMEKMKGQICCLKASNLVLFILAISMGALLGWFTLKCPLMHFC